MQQPSSIRLTLARIDALTCPPDKAEFVLWDTAEKGLGVRVRPSGKKSFVWQGRFAGKPIKITIGDCSTWGLDDARSKAIDLKKQIKDGIDPREQKRRQEEAETRARAERKKQTATFSDAWAAYIEERAGGWSDSYLDDHKKAMQAPGQKRKRHPGKTVAGPLWPFRDALLAELTPEPLETWLRKETAKRPTSTAKAWRMLRAFLNWCDDHPDYEHIVDASALLTKRVRKKAPKTKPAKERALGREQLAAWFEAVRALPNPINAAYLQGLLLTGARRNELLSLTWDGVDFKWRALHIHDKVEGDRTIPLTPYLASLLARLPRRNEWVFSTTRGATGRLSDVTRPHYHALQAAGLPHMSLHDLRRSFKSLSEWVEVPAGVVAQLMGHKPSATAEKHYSVRPLDLLRLWHDRIEAWILEQAGIEQPAHEQASRLVVVQ